MSAAAFRLLVFVVLATGCAALWLGFLRAGGGPLAVTPAVPSSATQSIFAPAPAPTPVAAGQTATTGQTLASGLTVHGIVTTPECAGCSVKLGSNGLVQAKLGAGSSQRQAYALLDIGNGGSDRRLFAHDVLGLGPGDTPAVATPVLQMLDSSHRVILQLVAQPDRHLRLISPAGGLRSTALDVSTGATVPNDGLSGVAIDLSVLRNDSLAVYVNGVRSVSIPLNGARTNSPRYLATGVLAYQAPQSAGSLVLTQSQVSVSTGSSSTPTQPASSTTAAAAPSTTSTPAPQPTTTQQQTTTPKAPATPKPTTTAAPPPPPPAPKPQPPAATTAPAVSGSRLIGSVLVADPGTWSGATSLAYGWQRCDVSGTCVAIDGAAARQYTLTSGDRGSYVRVKVTASNAAGTTSRSSAAIGPVTAPAPVALLAPQIGGDAIVGSILTALPGSWSDPSATFAYAWQRCDSTGACTTIATDTTYTVTTADLDQTIRVEVTAANDGGKTASTSVPTSAVIPPVPVPPVANGAPSIAGEAFVGSILTALPGSWSDPSATFAYAWQRCDSTGACTTIATGTSYTPTSDDLDQTIRVQVTAAGANGTTATANSATVGPIANPPAPAATSAPTVSGDTFVGSVLTASPGSWSDPSATLTYAWQRCDSTGACTTIATDTTYTVTTADLDQTIRVEVTATNPGGSTTADSTAVGPIANPPAPAATSAPTVSGDTFVGSVLTASPGSWSDPSATLTYAWQRCDSTGACTTIATDTTYTVTTADLDQTIRVEVTATNPGGSTTADSTAVGPIANPPAPAATTTTTTTAPAPPETPPTTTTSATPPAPPPTTTGTTTTTAPPETPPTTTTSATPPAPPPTTTTTTATTTTTTTSPAPTQSLPVSQDTNQTSDGASAPAGP